MRVAVVGLGHLGKIHAEIYQKYASKKGATFSLATVCDTTPEAEAWARQMKMPFEPDYRKLIGRVDAVSVVVPTTYHREVGGFFLEQGKDALT